ncbi:MAG: GAP family protein [Anaerolineae bacterium]|nr:GAP family protein [Anaerolineae bacterium]
MTELTLSLVALAIAAALQPPQVIALIILLQTRQGIANALAYLGGMIAFRLALGGVFWLLFSRLEENIETSGGEFNILVGAVLLVLGLLMLVYALRRSLSAQDEDQAAASWLDRLETISPRQALLVGVAFLALDPKDWIIDLSAINLIAEADLSGAASFLTYLAYILLAQSLLWLPLILMFVTPQRTRRSLATLNAWMKRHERSIEIATAIIFGLVFLYIGLENLDVL